MKRSLLALLLLLLLSGCKSWVTRWAAPPTTFPTPLVEQTPTFEPTPTFDLRRCIFVENFRPLQDVTDDLINRYTDAGFSSVEIQAEAYGQICLDENKEARQFLPRQTNIRLALPVDSLEDLDLLGNTLRDLLAVMDKMPQESLPGPDIGTFSVTFQAGGGDYQLTFPIDLGRRAYQRGLTGEDLINVLH